MKSEKKYLYYTSLETPLGEMIACSEDRGICMLEFADHKNLKKKLDEISKVLQMELIQEKNNYLNILNTELKEYFEKKRKDFSIPISMIGTEFQKEVWRTISKIPYGQTISYLQEARKMGRPKAVRAVANANGQNKISIVIPCHRIIGSNGKLTGYGGGVWRKQKLLELENVSLF